MSKFLSILLIFLISYPSSANSAELASISTPELKKIVNDESDLKLLFFFTSWCSVCKSSLKELFVLKDKYKNNPRVKIIPISIDDNSFMINSFVQNLPKTINEKIYHFYHSNSYDALKMFRELNVQYTGSIPYIALFGKNGDVIVNGSYQVSGFSVGIDRFLEKK